SKVGLVIGHLFFANDKEMTQNSEHYLSSPPSAGFFVSGNPMFKNAYFTEAELSCRCCGEIHFSDDTLRRLIRVREQFAKPMVITSGYRCQDHCAKIGSTMTHTTGQAVDVSVSGGRAYELLG
uniref:D-Ala-D-Ala carboxypeptidase family metallohydrolase n=1 Tax=uncultured Microbulbifer sp. TaxID=348147 RepID=UPI0026089C24